jgi:transposase
VRINDLERELTTSVKTLAPTLLTGPGIAVLTAAKILGETADVTQFKSKDAYAVPPAPHCCRHGQETRDATDSLAPGTAN